MRKLLLAALATTTIASLVPSDADACLIVISIGQAAPSGGTDQIVPTNVAWNVQIPVKYLDNLEREIGVTLSPADTDGPGEPVDVTMTRVGDYMVQIKPTSHLLPDTLYYLNLHLVNYTDEPRSFYFRTDVRQEQLTPPDITGKGKVRYIPETMCTAGGDHLQVEFAPLRDTKTRAYYLMELLPNDGIRTLTGTIYNPLSNALPIINYRLEQPANGRCFVVSPVTWTGNKAIVTRSPCIPIEGMQVPDAGVPVPSDMGFMDMGTIPPDGGTIPPDAGTISPDAGPRPDTAPPPANEGGNLASAGSQGCGCNHQPGSAPSAGWALALLLGTWGLIRRRRSL